MWGQIADDVPPIPEFDPQPVPFWVWLIGPLWSTLWLIYSALLVWMLIECVRKDPDRFLWIWIMLIFQPFGAVIYFLVRWLPGRDVRLPNAMRRWTRGKELTRLETAALQIGNAHQFVQWGDALREVGQHERAGSAYVRALEKDADSLQALWGAAQTDMHAHDFNSAHEHLEKVLAQDPQYKFGDVSLAYCKTLRELGRPDDAREQLEEHIRRWRHPEALFLLATIHVDAGRPQQAREQLQALLMDINSSPTGIARRHAFWKSKARRMLRKLPRA